MSSLIWIDLLRSGGLRHIERFQTIRFISRSDDYLTFHNTFVFPGMTTFHFEDKLQSVASEIQLYGTSTSCTGGNIHLYMYFRFFFQLHKTVSVDSWDLRLLLLWMNNQVIVHNVTIITHFDFPNPDGIDPG